MSNKKTHEEYESELFELESSAWPIETYKGSRVKILHECLAGHKWSAEPRKILEGNGCPTCSGKKVPSDEDYKDKATKHGFTVLEPYINARTAILHKCSNNHTFKISPTNVYRGNNCPVCSVESGGKGVYNDTYFYRYPEKAKSPGILYVVVLVSKSTNERKCVKIGITKGSAYKDVVKRSAGFKGYDLRIQKIITGTLKEVYDLEQKLHNKWAAHRYTKSHKFGGYTELFEIEKLSDILKSIQDFI